jgi:hypothetical protein
VSQELPNTDTVLYQTIIFNITFIHLLTFLNNTTIEMDWESIADRLIPFLTLTGVYHNSLRVVYYYTTTYSNISLLSR